MRIGILVTTFNSEATIGEVIESLKKQGEPLRKISALYIADGGSKDRTMHIIREAWDAEVPLKAVQKPKNAGEYRAVNLALEEIGKDLDWVLRLHSDNPVKPHWLETMLPHVESCPENIATICSSWDTRNNSKIIPGEDAPDKGVVLIHGNDRSVRDTLLQGCWWHNCGCAIRLKAFSDIGPFNPDLKQKADWHWLLRCLHKGWSIQYVPRTLFYYDVGGKDALSAKNFQRDIDVRESLTIFREFLNAVSFSDIIRFHGHYSVFVIRRLLRAIISFRIKRLPWILIALCCVIGSFFKSAWQWACKRCD